MSTPDPYSADPSFKLDAFTRGFLSTALQALGDPDANDYAGMIVKMPGQADRHISTLFVEGLPRHVLVAAKRSCDRFRRLNAKALDEACDSVGYDAHFAGSDFFLTRNLYGVGYFDRDALKESCRESLTRAAETTLSAELYIGDGGKLCFLDSVTHIHITEFDPQSQMCFRSSIDALFLAKVEDPVGRLIVRSAAEVFSSLYDQYAVALEARIARANRLQARIAEGDRTSEPEQTSELGAEDSLEQIRERIAYLERAELLFHKALLNANSAALYQAASIPPIALSDAIRFVGAVMRLEEELQQKVELLADDAPARQRSISP